MGIPTVQILIGGHLSDLARVAKSVACQTPVVICQGKSCLGLVSIHKNAGNTLLAINLNIEFLSYKSTQKKLVIQLRTPMLTKKACQTIF